MRSKADGCRNLRALHHSDHSCHFRVTGAVGSSLRFDWIAVFKGVKLLSN